MAWLAFLFKLLPLLKPFIKEAFFGKRIPRAGQKRNPLIPFLALIMIGGCVITGLGVYHWVRDYDHDQKKELDYLLLKQQLDDARAQLIPLKEELYAVRLEKRSFQVKMDETQAKNQYLASANGELQTKLTNSEAHIDELNNKLKMAELGKTNCPKTKPSPSNKVAVITRPKVVPNGNYKQLLGE